MFTAITVFLISSSAVACPTFTIKAQAPNCQPSSFYYEIAKYPHGQGSGAELLEKTIFPSEGGISRSIDLCDGSYAIAIGNDGGVPSCSPGWWNITNSKGETLFSSSTPFHHLSQCNFDVKSNSCFQTLGSVLDNSWTPTNSNCVVVSPATHFWLHTAWGIVLIVILCLLFLFVLAVVFMRVCCYKDKNQNIADKEQQPLLNNQANMNNTENNASGDQNKNSWIRRIFGKQDQQVQEIPEPEPEKSSWKSKLRFGKKANYTEISQA